MTAQIAWRALTGLECLRLLSGQRIGRLGFVSGDHPLVLPVTYMVHDDEVVFRTGRDSKLRASLGRAKVAFEIDEVDPSTRTGWSVLVKGVAEHIAAGPELEALRELALAPWAPGDRDVYIKVRAEEVTGRRIEVPDALADIWLG